jgi:ribosomal protein S12 methylthiotransferase accessory factor
MTDKWQLRPAPKRFTLDQDKIMAPEETVRKLRERLALIDLDILKEVERIDNGRLDIPVYISRCGRDASAVTGTRKQMGKGGTPAQAEASAVMELAERFSFFSFKHDARNFRTATFEQMGDRALPIGTLGRSVNDDGSPEKAGRLLKNLPLKWAQGYSLTRDRPVWIPFDWFYAINAFNGPSAGNCLEEAMSQGICEVVERHVSAVVAKGRLSVPSIRPESATDPLVREMLAKYRRAGIRVTLSDFSLDTGIPTVGALAWDPSTFPGRSEIVWTAGTTPDPEKALSRALTEVAQLAGDFNTGAGYVASGLPRFNTVSEAAYITSAPKSCSLAELPDLTDRDIRREVENLVTALASADFEVLLIDVTHPQVQVPALYTMIPGTQFRERADGACIGMFAAKLTTESLPAAEAAVEIDRMEKADPGRYYYPFYRGTCRLALDEPMQALGQFHRALEMSPEPQDLPSIYTHIGICNQRMGDFPPAREALEMALNLDPESPEILNHLGVCQYKMGAYESAIASFLKAIDLEPGSAINYANIGVNYRELGRKQKAVEYYRMALAIDPQIAFARQHLAELTGGGR